MTWHIVWQTNLINKIESLTKLNDDINSDKNVVFLSFEMHFLYQVLRENKLIKHAKESKITNLDDLQN